MKYRQCSLRRTLSETSYQQQLSYLPEPFAAVGQRLQLKDPSQGWVGGWTVLSVGDLVEGELVEGAAHNSDSIWEPSAKLTSRGKK